jgi:nucleoside-diphosphate-sugar epimerase
VYFGRCLVVGGRGWLGSHICAALTEAGNQVTALGRNDLFQGRFDLVVVAAPVEVEEWCERGRSWHNAPVLFLSSGAAVLKPESYRGGYGQEKQRNEAVCRRYAAHIARVFSVLGPGIPLDAHYAASSFLSQAKRGGPVVVHDGAIRSYLHPQDVASALLTILAQGDGEPYDVGGCDAITVAELGQRIAAAAGVACHMAEPFPSDVYLPDLTRLHGLGWKQTITTDQMIRECLDL